MTHLLSTKEVANFLKVNEKMVYTLVAEKGLPASKITGKWAFPKHLVEQWIETNTINYPHISDKVPNFSNLLVISGSNDILLEKAITFFNQQFPEYTAVFGNKGSLGGLRSLRQNQCHIASSHLLQEDEKDYNFEFAVSELENMPAIVNFCRREQGLIIQKGNPRSIKTFADIGKPGIRIVNRPLATGTRLLFDKELSKVGIRPEKITGYDVEVARHLDAGLEVLSGRVDVAPGIRIVAKLLDLEFIPLRWERFDLLISKDKFFEKPVQLFLGLLHEEKFQAMVEPDSGYTLDITGKVVFPTEKTTSEPDDKES